jgi:hypothetical protein
MFAPATSGALRNFFSRNEIVADLSWPYIHSIRPSAHMFRARRPSRWESPNVSTALRVRSETGSRITRNRASDSFSRGLAG